MRPPLVKSLHLLNGYSNHKNNGNEVAQLINNFSYPYSLTSLTVQAPESETTAKILDGWLIIESDALHTIEESKVNKTPGPNKITYKILKNQTLNFDKPLDLLISKYRRTDKVFVPSDWKRAKVTVINDLSNFDANSFLTKDLARMRSDGAKL